MVPPVPFRFPEYTTIKLLDFNCSGKGKPIFFFFFRDVKIEDTYFDRDVEKAFMKASTELFEQKTKASLLISNQNGNMYTPSVYGCLASVLAQ